MLFRSTWVPFFASSCHRVSDGFAPGTNRGFFYLKSVCLITKIGKAIKINAKPSKKQSPTNNNCITAIDNATPYATLTIKNRAIKAIIFFHPFHPSECHKLKPPQPGQSLKRKTNQSVSFHVSLRGYAYLLNDHLIAPIRIGIRPGLCRLPGLK